MEKQLLQDLVEYLPCGAIYLQGNQLVLNGLAESLTGYSRHEIENAESFLQKLFREKSSDFRKLFEKPSDGKRIKNVGSPYLIEIRHRSGEIRTVQFSLYRTSQVELFLMNDASEELRSENKINLILSEKKLAEQQLNENKTRLQLALSSNGIGTYTWYFHDKKLDLDPLASQIFQLTEDLTPIEKEKQLRAQILNEDHDRLLNKLKTMVIREDTFNERFRIVWPQGDVRHLRTQATLLKDGQGHATMITGVVWDITEEVQVYEAMEAQKTILINSAKMATLGEMSGGIAHEINNPLSVIKGRADQLQGYVEKKNYTDEKLLVVADAINRMCDRITRIVRGLRTFARDGHQDPYEMTRVDQVIEETLNLCREKFLNHGVKIETLYPKEPVEIMCQQVQLEQALLNLLSNSYDAIMPLENKWIRIQVQANKDFAEILISDSGPGIAKPIAEKIMQPFFTTKEVGQGTGLGLSISRGIVEAHGGSLSLDADLSYTQFTVRLPQAQAPAQSA